MFTNFRVEILVDKMIQKEISTKYDPMVFISHCVFSSVAYLNIILKTTTVYWPHKLISKSIGQPKLTIVVADLHHLR